MDRLEKDELNYELSIRGAPPTDATTVKVMRKSLRDFLRLEKSGTQLQYPKYPFTFKTDVEQVTAKIAEITALVQNFSDDDTSSQYLKIQSKLAHAFGRAERIVAGKDEEHGQRSKFLVELVGLHSSLKSRARKFKRSSLLVGTPLELSLQLGTAENESETETDSDDDNNEPLLSSTSASVQASGPSTSHHQSIPVAKWNLAKYDGSNSKISLSAFLESVEELRMSRGVSLDQLFRSASDLFTGRALIWYRAIKSRVHDWTDLVRELRSEFQPTNFNDKLFEEIRRRTQGNDESMGMYIAIMTNMFNRLTIPVSESVRLKVILNNITPFYQSQLGLTKVDSIDHLVELGRQLEARKERIEAFVPPPRNRGNLMEPDLAFVYTEPEGDRTTSTNLTSVASALVCWNCKATGHRASNCAAPRQRTYCFRCGTPGVTVRTCQKCGQRSGNASGGH